MGSTDQPRVLLKKILFILHKRYHVFSRSTGILLRRHPQYFCIPFLRGILPLQKHTQTAEPSDEHHATARLRAQRGKRKEKCRSLSFPYGLLGRVVSLVAGPRSGCCTQARSTGMQARQACNACTGLHASRLARILAEFCRAPHAETKRALQGHRGAITKEHAEQEESIRECTQA